MTEFKEKSWESDYLSESDCLNIRWILSDKSNDQKYTWRLSSYSEKAVWHQRVGKNNLNMSKRFHMEMGTWGFPPFGNVILQNRSPLKPQFTHKSFFSVYNKIVFKTVFKIQSKVTFI